MAESPYVNTHVHTPWSFSAYASLSDILADAIAQRIAALSISDFNSIDGFEEWAQLCENQPVYPLFSIEFLALSREDKLANQRWNDPKNPGVMYFCGKALCWPSSFSHESIRALTNLREGTQLQINEVIDKLQNLLRRKHIDAPVDYASIQRKYSNGIVRERHVAKALFYTLEAALPDPVARITAYRTLFDDPNFSADLADSTSLQNEIRARLLKAGKPAFVEEKEEAFLSPERVRELVLDGGGIPCYPILADDRAGLNEHECDPERLADTLIGRGVHAVEFIPQRNSLKLLKRYVRVFRARGFCITFGTEHNTPRKLSLVPAARGQTPLDSELREVAFEGAGILAAHQERLRQGHEGFVAANGRQAIAPGEVKSFAAAGQKSILDRFAAGR